MGLLAVLVAIVASACAATTSGTESSTDPKPCPPAPECPAPPEPKVVKVPARCAPCSASPPKVSARVADSTCVTGTVQTAGDMVFVVQRAKVTVRRETAALGSTWTDNQGRYVWCRGTNAAGGKVTVVVEKPPFRPAKQDIEWKKGQHAAVDFRLEAEGLTTPVE